MGNRRNLRKIWVIGTAVFGSISLWIFGMLSGGIGFDMASIGGHFALLIGGAILGAGVGLLSFPILKMVSSRLRNLKNPYPQHESTLDYMLDRYKDGLTGGIFGALLGIVFANILNIGNQVSDEIILLGGWILGSLLGSALADFVIIVIQISPKRIHLALGGFIGGFVAYLIIALFLVYFYSL